MKSRIWAYCELLSSPIAGREEEEPHLGALGALVVANRRTRRRRAAEARRRRRQRKKKKKEKKEKDKEEKEKEKRQE